MTAFRAATATAAFGLLLTAATVAHAHVGTAHMLGETTRLANDDYLMCGKCNWDPASSTGTSAGSIGDATAFYKLTCDTAATNASKWATLHYHCSHGCNTCLKEFDIVMGEKIDAVYTTASLAIHRTAASINCCPEIVQRTYWTDGFCASVGKSTYQPAGCSWSESSSTYEQLVCDDDGKAPERWYSGCSSSPALSNGDECPSDRSCTASVRMSNLPCLKLNGITSALHSKQTYKCRKDGNQMCLRAVRSSDYVASMTPGVDGDLAKLKCSDLYSGVGDHRYSAAATLAIALTTIFATLL